MAICRNKENNDLYQYLGENRYRNLRTKVEGIVPENLAQKIFVINLEATYFLHNCPEFGEFINKLNLKYDGVKRQDI